MEFENYSFTEEPVVEEAPKPAKRRKNSQHVVVSSDTWGRLIEVYGKDLPSRNNLSIHQPLTAGQRLEV